MTNEYELADDNRADLIYTKSELLAPLLPGMERPPHPMRLGDDESDYYRGTFRQPAQEQPEFDLQESALRDLAQGEQLAGSSRDTEAGS
jgi:hypothetical protein